MAFIKNENQKGFFPYEIIFSVTDLCNLKCNHCYIKKNNAKLYVDISWVGIDDYKNDTRHMEKLVGIIKKLKNSSKGDMTERILFGTDIPIARYGEAEGTKIYGDYIKDISKAIKKEFPLYR